MSKSGHGTGAEAARAALHNASIRHVFGIPGVQNMHLFDALVDSAEIEVVVNRHEQGAAFMADAYARVSGDVGVAAVITGPGVTNALTGLAEAYADSSPLVMIAAQIPTTLIGRRQGIVHELPDQMGMVEQVVGWAARAERADDVEPLLSEAIATARRTRKPAYLEFPLDLQAAEVLSAAPEQPGASAVAVDERQTQAAAEALIARLAAAKRPLLYVGGGMATPAAREALKAFAEATDTPVLTTVKGKSAMPGDHPLCAGASSWAPVVSESSLLEESDLVIALGTKLSGRLKYATGGRFNLPEPILHVDIDPDVAPATPVAESFTADAVEVLRKALAEGVGGASGEANPHAASQRGASQRADGAARVTQFQAEVRAAFERQPPAIPAFLQALRAGAEPGTIFGCDNSLAGIWSARYLPLLEGEHFLFPMGYGTLGYALPSAIGGLLAQPGTPTIALTGDGGLLFTLEELATARRCSLDLTILLINDGLYGSVAFNQKSAIGRTAAVTLANPDFSLISRAFGVDHRRVDELDALPAELRAARERSGITMIEMDGQFIDRY